MTIFPYAEIDRSGALISDVMRRTATPRKPQYRPSMSVKPNMNTAARNTSDDPVDAYLDRPVEERATLRESKGVFEVVPMPRCVSAASTLDG
jgi:histone deacetylase complex regulatory component SIN3